MPKAASSALRTFIYMRYLGQVATNWVHTWYKKKSQLFFLSHHWSLFVVTEANNTITMKDAWRDCEVSVFVYNKNINFTDDVWTPGRTINVRYHYNRGEAVIGSTWVIIGSWSQGPQVTGIKIWLTNEKQPNVVEAGPLSMLFYIYVNTRVARDVCYFYSISSDTLRYSLV